MFKKILFFIIFIFSYCFVFPVKERIETFVFPKFDSTVSQDDLNIFYTANKKIKESKKNIIGLTTGLTSLKTKDFSKEKKDFYINKLSSFSDVNIFLTFDDGPSVYTSEILDVLSENSVKASFFVVADNIKYFEKAFIRTINNGHDIGSHTFSHMIMSSKDTDYIKNDISKADKIIKEYYPNLIFFRPPGLEYSYKTNDLIISEYNYKMVYGYCPEDWKYYNVGGGNIVTILTLKCVYEYLNYGTNNIIIVLHDGGGNRKQTILSVSELIKIFKSLDFNMLKLSDIY